jgi:DNA-binding XRE family transcriptional regulator
MRLPRFENEKLLTESLKNPQALEIYEKIIIGKQLKTLRQKSKLTQKQIASALKTSQSAIARIENGKQNLTLQTLVKLAFFLKKKLLVRFD